MVGGRHLTRKRNGLRSKRDRKKRENKPEDKMHDA